MGCEQSNLHKISQQKNHSSQVKHQIHVLKNDKLINNKANYLTQYNENMIYIPITKNIVSKQPKMERIQQVDINRQNSLLDQSIEVSSFSSSLQNSKKAEIQSVQNIKNIQNQNQFFNNLDLHQNENKQNVKTKRQNVNKIERNERNSKSQRKEILKEMVDNCMIKKNTNKSGNFNKSESASKLGSGKERRVESGIQRELRRIYDA